MKLSIGYGTGVQRLDMDEGHLLGVLAPKPQEDTHSQEEEEVVLEALGAPIGTPRLAQLAHKGQKVVVITSDITRPLPSYKILPYVVDELVSAGVVEEDITVVLALGIHRKHTSEEIQRLCGPEVYSRVRCIDSDVDDVVHMGRTKAGTPVDIFTPVAKADIRIGIGNIEYHYFAGYSGGAKAIMPGVSTREAINANHSMMVDEDAVQGKLEGNPVRQDLEEAIGLCPLHFIVNVVLDENKRITHCVSGHFIDAHRVGCKLLDEVYSIKIKAPADIVVAAQGGHPKDINLYQLQKALDNAKFAVKEGGVIILVGACGEGLGEDVFEEWILGASEPRELVERIGADFQLGGHKAAAIAMVLAHADIYLVSEMDDGLVERMFMKPFSSVQQAYEAARIALGADARTIVMPYAGSTLPSVANS